MTFIVSKVSKRHSSDWVLRDIEFSMQAGTVFGVLGEDGSGKSTLMAILSGRMSPNTGTYGLAGEIEEGNGVGLKTPKTSLIGGGHGRVDGLKSFLGFNGIRSRPHSMREIIAKIEGVRDGQLLLIDDVLARFDEDDKERFAKNLRTHTANKQLFTIVSSRHFSDIAMLCDEATILDKTCQIQTGSPQELYLEPKSVKAAILTGAVNLMTARRTSSTKSEHPIFRLIDTPQDVLARPTSKADLGPINQNVNLMIRPEAVSISFGASFPEDNLIKGKIIAIDFRGPFTYLRLDCEGLAITANVPKVIGLSIGDECVIGLPPDRIHVLKS